MKRGKLGVEAGQFGDMYLTQPPARYVQIKVYGQDNPVEVLREAGVRLSDFVEVLGTHLTAGVSEHRTHFHHEWPVFEFEKEYFDEKGVAARVEVEKHTAVCKALEGYEDGLFDDA